MSDEREWGYDTDALNVLDKFHQVAFVVYVEGSDDIVFWSTLFSKAGRVDFYIDDAGGIKELEKIMLQIINEDARVIVACDSHYSFLLGTSYIIHDRIIRTLGYSIENTMYCPNILNQAINKLCRTLEDRTDTIHEWINEFCSSAKILLIYDLASAKYGKAVRVLGDKCSRFLKSSTSEKLDDNKISEHIQGINIHFKPNELNECERLIDGCGREVSHIVKGCFLTNGVINLIKKIVKKCIGRNPVISLDNLYALTSDGCRACTFECPDFNFVEEQIQKAVASVRLL